MHPGGVPGGRIPAAQPRWRGCLQLVYQLSAAAHEPLALFLRNWTSTLLAHIAHIGSGRENGFLELCKLRQGMAQTQQLGTGVG